MGVFGAPLVTAVMLAAAIAQVRGAGAGLDASANGGFQVTLSGQLRTISFSAQRDASNNSRGQGELFNHVTGTKLHLDIDCLQVVGTVATISGMISRTNNPLIEEDTPFWLRVVDNGEGAKRPPDLTSSVIAFLGGPGPSCTTTYPTGMIPIEGGNIQVH
jgi:hypothetical protein